jgi:hypothetical protein
MKKTVLIIFFVFLLSGHIIYAKGNVEENPNDIAKYYQEQINNKILKPLSVLQKIDFNVYNIIINYLPENESIENYYYMSSIVAKETGDTIEVYEIFYYEILLNKYKHYRGDPTRKYFTIEFNLNKEFIRRYFWR